MTEQERYKFATYMRDPTNLDYANQRYYSSTIGRFLASDPYVANSSLAEPQSWNRYAYVVNDSVNFLDPSGLMRVQDCVLHPEYCQGAPPADWFRHGGAYAPEPRQPSAPAGGMLSCRRSTDALPPGCQRTCGGDLRSGLPASPLPHEPQGFVLETAHRFCYPR